MSSHILYLRVIITNVPRQTRTKRKLRKDPDLGIEVPVGVKLISLENPLSPKALTVVTT